MTDEYKGLDKDIKKLKDEVQELNELMKLIINYMIEENIFEEPRNQSDEDSDFLMYN